MDQSRFRLSLLKALMVVLAMTSWAFVSFILATRPELTINPPISIMQDPLASLVRLPASIPNQLPGLSPSAVRIDEKKMELVALRCWDRDSSELKPTQARWIRLVGRPCLSDPTADAIVVTNLTNGYKGTIFETGAQQLSTDFMPLNQGENDIRVTVGEGLGVSYEHQFAIVRAEP